MEIKVWLESQDLGRHAAAFMAADIGMDVLTELADADLKELGLSLGDRKRLLKAIAALQATPNLAEAPSLPFVSARPREAERRQLTVMFVDLVGSTALSQRLDPEDMGQILKAYQNAVVGEISRLDGFVAKLMGDGVLAYFGWPKAHEDEAERAVRAGMAIVAAVARLVGGGEALACRIGIATGLVVVGDLIGEGASQEEAVVGDTPNLAARLQALAEPGQVVVAEATRRLLGSGLAIASLGAKVLKGLTEPVQTFRVLGERTVESRFAARVGVTVLPMVGRDEELALLLRHWRQAVAGEGQAVLLVGEAGMGKSRLVRALREAVMPDRPTVLFYQCSAFHGQSPFWPVTQQLAFAARFEPGDDAAVRRSKLASLLGSSGEPLALLAALLGIPTEPDPLAALTPQERRGRTLTALVDQLLALAAKAPVVVLFEDLHWIDPTSLELLQRTLSATGTARVLLMMTSRPEGEPTLDSFPQLSRLILHRLGRAAVDAIVGQLLATRAMTDELRDVILERTDGVPLYVEELTKAVLEAAPAGAGVVVPASLQDSLLARLDRDPLMATVAQIAACIGREIDHSLLEAVAEMPPADLALGLEALVRAELVYRRGLPPAAAYTFKHALVRDAAYESLLKSRRREMHGRIAACLQALDPAAVRNEPEILAFHLSRSASPAEAAPFWLKAGDLAKSRYARQEAKNRYEASLDCLRGDGTHVLTAAPAIERQAHLALGDLAGLADDIEGANAHYEAALALGIDAAEQAFARNKLHRAVFASREGVALAYYTHGTGRPTILFVNPIVYGLAPFHPILERLCQDFRVITVDCKGAGRSDPLLRPYGIRQHALDLLAVIEAAADGPIVGVGISRGSNQLVWIAKERPELFAALVLVGTPTASAMTGSQTFFNEEYLRRRAEAYADGDAEQLIQIQAHYVYTEPYVDELRRLMVQRGKAMPRETLLSFFDADSDMNIVPLLGSLRVPTLVGHGREDRLTSFAAAEFLADRIPGAVLFGFDGKGHVPMFTAPDEFCRVLKEFIRTGTVRGASRAGERGLGA